MHTRLESYLEELERPLEGLSVDARREWREEAQQHLLALVEAHEELGRTPEEAVEAAISSFGNAEQLGQEMRRELTPRAGEQFLTGLRGALRPWRSRAGNPWEGLGRAFGLFTLPAFAAFVAVVVPFLHLLVNDGPEVMTVLTLSGQIGYWLVPLVGGAWLGRWSGPQRTEPRTNLPGLLLGLVGACPFANFLRLVAANFIRPTTGWEYLLFWLAHGLGAYLLTRLVVRGWERWVDRKTARTA